VKRLRPHIDLTEEGPWRLDLYMCVYRERLCRGRGWCYIWAPAEGGGGGLGPSPHLLGRMVAGWRQIQRDILMRNFSGQKRQFRSMTKEQKASYKFNYDTYLKVVGIEK
jgi:hypothetical protein